MSNLLPSSIHPGTKVMVFVDGENLAIRYYKILGEQKSEGHIKFKKDVYVWSGHLNHALTNWGVEVIRKYYYTSVQGDIVKLESFEEELIACGIESPQVFKKDKGKGSKRVDISLATDMLSHAFRKNYDVAVLVAGDEDYIPLVEAVKAEGRRVVLWFVENGLNHALRRKADYYFDLGQILFEDNTTILHRLVTQ